MGAEQELKDVARHAPAALRGELGALAQLHARVALVDRKPDAAAVRELCAPIEASPLAPYVLAAYIARVQLLQNVGNARSLASYTVKRYGDEGRLALAWLFVWSGDVPLARILLAELEGHVTKLPIERVAPAILSGLTSRKADVRAQASRLMLEAGARIRPALEAARKEASSARKKLFAELLKALDEAASGSAARSEEAPNEDPLAQASAAAARADWASAALALRAAWEATRDPRVAARCEEVSRSVRGERPALPTRKAAASWWETTAQHRGSAAVPILLRAAWPDDPKEAKLRASLLARLPPDPRIAAAAAALLLGRRYTMYQGNVAEEALMKLLVAHADPRFLAPIRALGPELLAAWGPGSRPSSRVALLSGDTLAKALEKLPRTEAHGSVDATLAAIDAALAGAPHARAAALLEDVLARPADLAARSVYADLLCQEGDPRGELIQVQLARAAGDTRRELERREASLLHAHLGEWVEPFPLAKRTSARFARGFLDEVDLDPPAREDRARAVLETRMFRTVRRVGLRGAPGVAADDLLAFAGRLLGADAFASLEALHGLPRCGRFEGRAGLVELGLTQTEGLPVLAGLPSLRRLVVASLGACQGPFGDAPIEAIDCVVANLGGDRLRAALLTLPASVHRLRVHATFAGLAEGIVRLDEIDHLALERADDGVFRAVTLAFQSAETAAYDGPLWSAAAALIAGRGGPLAIDAARVAVVDPARGAERVDVLRGRLTSLRGVAVTHPFAELA